MFYLARKRLSVLGVLSILAICLLSACSSTDDEKYSGPGKIRLPYSSDDWVDNIDRENSNIKNTVYPWEVWSLNKDLTGAPLANIQILKADEIFRHGKRSEALNEYHSVDKRRLLPQEEEALVLRVASTQLALGYIKDSLSTISDFFTLRNQSAEEVNAYFSLVLAYAYAETNDFDQSFAWFSRVHKLSTNNRTLDLIAVSGLSTYLRKVPKARFEKYAEIWKSDQFVSTQISKERELRSRIEPVEVNESYDDSTSTQTHVAANSIPIALLLPLSGKFAALGRNTQNGLELALNSVSIADVDKQSSMSIVARDTAGDVNAVASQINELSLNVKPRVIIGPLLSDEAVVASEIARQHAIPLLTFSKKNSFQFSSGVFRLGATATSQVRSLLRLASNVWHVNQYALVYPSDANGLEFANTFRALVPEYGGEIVFDRTYSKDDLSSLITIAQELERTEVKALFLADNLQSSSRLVANLTQGFRDNVKIMGTASWDDMPLLARYQTALHGAVFVSPFFIKSQRPEVVQFVSSYRAKYNIEPDFLAAQGFDAGSLIAATMQESLNSNISFNEAFAKLGSYNGLTGKITINPNGECERNYSLVEFMDGQLRELEVTESIPSYVLHGNE
jgi:branched-chain amino acid transport system substrate-binding protein